MKSKLRIIVLAFLALFVFSANFFSQESEDAAQNQTNEDNEDAPDIYDEDADYVYLQNAPGDQYINIRVMPGFPLNFGDKMKIGGEINVSYNRFLTSWLAVGAELAFGYNPTIGSNIFTYIPLSVGVTFLPAIKKFEFPITLNVGMAVENYLSNTYFPGLVLRAGAGAYYRINESWSAGLEGFFAYMPQWYFKNPEKNDYLNIAYVSAGVKYHF
ncbi:MAG: hypothetical protein II814_14445 [Treponema sp.]|nr:hypothetical protein [Treponema sp.]